MKILRTITLTCLAFAFIINAANAQVEKLKAAYIYNFAVMSNYPSSHQSGDFTIAVIGSNPIIAELEVIAKTKKVGAQNIVIKKISSTAEIGNAHIVFVPEDYKSKLTDVVTKTSSNPTLIVSESAGLCTKGAVFNLTLVDQKLRFEVNEGKANSKGVKLAANLVKLGILVN